MEDHHLSHTLEIIEIRRKTARFARISRQRQAAAQRPARLSF
jgi:hypothetical protein